jgi:hypothetical protein
MQTQKMYGAWIDKKGNMIPVIEEESHAEIALRDILKAKKELRKYSSYEIMMRLGYVRIVFVKSGHLAEYHKKHGCTKKQKSWVDTAEKVDIWQ